MASEGDAAEVDEGVFVVAGGDAAPVLGAGCALGKQRVGMVRSWAER